MLTFGNPANPPLIFLHGFLGSRASWRAIARPLSANFFCLLPDLPGHGKNPWPLDAPLNFEILDDWLFRLLDDFSAPKIHLAGYSLGGRAALNFACRFPERILSLTLESASPGLPAPAARALRLEQDSARAESLLREGLPAFLEKWYAMPLFASLQTRPALLAALKKSAAQNDPRQMAKIIHDLSPGLQKPLWQELPGLTFPVLLLAGQKDEKYASLAPQMAARLPAARLEIIRGAGHNLHAEKPQAVLRAMKNALGV